MTFRDRRVVLPALIIVGFVLGIYFTSTFNTMNTVGTASGIQYWSEVCVTKTDGETGEKTLLRCSHNLFSDTGKNAVKDRLMSGTPSSAFDDIAVANGTQAGASNITNEIQECGLSRAAGTVSSNSTAGVWFIEKVFTVSSCGGTIRVNATGLFNGTPSPAAVYFAGNNFTNADIQNADQLNVTWTIAVT